MKIYIHDDFDLEKIAGCGQCFRARKLNNGSYRFIVQDKALILSQNGREITADCSDEDWRRYWEIYFDMGRNYAAVRESIPQTDLYLANAAREGKGIRILRQDPWETLITFILSQRKSIPAIKACVENLSAKYGKALEKYGETLYSFPTAKELSFSTEEDLLDCKLGYRAGYVLDAVQKINSGEINLQRLNHLPDDELLCQLKRIKGVGEKVASCVALFAYGRMACVPVDTWIGKVIQNEYKGKNPFPAYGDFAGILQQYAFYMALKNKR